MYKLLTSVALVLTAMTAHASGLAKYYECDGLGNAANLRLVIDVRQTNAVSGTYRISDSRESVEIQNRDSANFIYLTAGHLQFNAKNVDGPAGILLSVVKQRSEVKAFHHALRAYFSCHN